MKALLLAVALLTGCSAAATPKPDASPSPTPQSVILTPTIHGIHDDVNLVTCWSISTYTLYCIPDYQLRK